MSVVEWMSKLTAQTRWREYNQPLGLTLDGQNFLCATNGALLVGVRSDEPAPLPAHELPDYQVASMADLLRARSVAPFTTELAKLKEWVFTAGEPPHPQELHRYGLIAGCLYNLNFLAEVLAHLGGTHVSVGSAVRHKGICLIIRSADPLWKILIMETRPNVDTERSRYAND